MLTIIPIDHFRKWITGPDITKVDFEGFVVSANYLYFTKFRSSKNFECSGHTGCWTNSIDPYCLNSQNFVDSCKS